VRDQLEGIEQIILLQLSGVASFVSNPLGGEDRVA
jgi:hypothetical protein